MPLIKYKEFNFGAAKLNVIAQAKAIIAEYSAQGYDLTLRQLYYQFVARALIANKVQEYNRLGGIINDARLAGLIDWDHITDRTRSLQGNTHWDSPSQIMRAVASQFKFDKWQDQKYRLEVWVEKEALAGVFERVCRSLDLDWFSCRGYVSQSEMWAAAQRLRAYAKKGQYPIILHFGDHDPSGIDMTRDIRERLEMFRAYAEVKRMALNMDQVEEYTPPPNPAKTTDSRFEGYLSEFGDESWELDALEPSILSSMVDAAAADYRDETRWQIAVEREREAKALLQAGADNWDDVTNYLRENFDLNYNDDEA